MLSSFASASVRASACCRHAPFLACSAGSAEGAGTVRNCRRVSSCFPIFQLAHASMFYSKPETALKQAKDLVEVGRPMLALEALHDLVSNRKHRTWTRTHEEIMIMFMDLCITLNQPQLAKDGLHQYKTICQLSALPSLEKVVRHYIKCLEDKVKSAKGEADKLKFVLDVDDLENIETPESVLMAAVSEEGTKERSDREVLTPWLRFLWEAYRTVLDILRNNSKLERFYQEIVVTSFQFCITFDRKKEFRGLCDMLRKHYQQIGKATGPLPNAINPNNPDSIQIVLETRISQLSAAAKMNLWQEAFRAVQDVSDLMKSTKRTPRPQLLAQFYEQLATVCLVLFYLR